MTHDFPELGPWRRRGPLLLLALAVGLAFFQNLGSAPLFDRDEGAFSEATREMVESGNYVSTTLNGEPRYDKPILTYYFQAVGVAVLGWNEWGLRFHSALAAALWVLAVWGFARREWDETTGWVAGILTATSLWVMVIGRAATADALLNLFFSFGEVGVSVPDGTGPWLPKPEHMHEKSALSAPASPHDDEDVSLTDFKVEIPHQDEIPEGHGQAFDGDGHGPVISPSVGSGFGLVPVGAVARHRGVRAHGIWRTY